MPKIVNKVQDITRIQITTALSQRYDSSFHIYRLALKKMPL